MYLEKDDLKKHVYRTLALIYLPVYDVNVKYELPEQLKKNRYKGEFTVKMIECQLKICQGKIKEPLVSNREICNLCMEVCHCQMKPAK